MCIQSIRHQVDIETNHTLRIPKYFRKKLRFFTGRSDVFEAAQLQIISSHQQNELYYRARAVSVDLVHSHLVFHRGFISEMKKIQL